MFNVVARKFRDLMHHFEHSRDDLPQDVRLFADGFICNLVRQRQNALQPIKKLRRCLVVFVLFFQKLRGKMLRLPLMQLWRARTSNVTLATPKTAFVTGFNYGVSTPCWFPNGELTSANTTPYLIALFTALSSDPLSSGVYSCNSSSSL